MDEVILKAVLCSIFIISTIVVFIYKTTIHLKHPRFRKRLIAWFHFNRYELLNSSSDRSLRLKKKQNKLTWVFLLFILLSLVSLALP